MYFAIGELFKVACRAEIFIGEGKIDWVDVCCYLGVNICGGKYFCTDCEEGRRKFCAAANGVITNKFALSEKCYTHIWRTQCILILTYGAGMWKFKNEKLHKFGVSFNNAVRKVFGYRRINLLRVFCEVFVCSLWICILIVCVCYCCVIV